MPIRLARTHSAVRAFIHTSSRSCGATGSPIAFSWPATSTAHETNASGPVATSSAPFFGAPKAARLYNDDDAPPTAHDVVDESEYYTSRQQHDPYKVEVRGEYIERQLPDKRSGKLVKYVFPKPGFSLKSHPLAAHPCVSGLGLDHGTLVPYKPIPAWEVIRRKRDAQRAHAQGDGQCNLPPQTLGTWIAFWDEHPPTRSRRLPVHAAYNEPITYKCSYTKRAPKFARGPNSVLLTCFLRVNHAADNVLKFDELGMPAHVAELLLALPVKAFDSGTQDLPTVTRISPIQYVLTCRSPLARRALLAGWREYESEVEKTTGRMPPYTIEADEQPSTHEPAAQTSQPTSTSPYAFLRGSPPPDNQGLDARLDDTGRLWLGGARYARLEDLPSMLLQGPRSKSSTSATTAPRRREPPLEPAVNEESQPAPSKIVRRRRTRYVEDHPRLWAMPPELAKLLS